MAFLERMRTGNTERCRVSSVELLVIQHGGFFASIPVFRYGTESGEVMDESKRISVMYRHADVADRLPERQSPTARIPHTSAVLYGDMENL